jgi:redox-sensitive bicupin YhaK (pirin superfamily)
MSAGTGVAHSEMNANTDQAAEFLQIWVLPKTRDITPNYSQITLDPKALDNKLDQVVSPNDGDRGVTVNQDAWFHLGNLSAGTTIKYDFKKSGNGVYAFILEGDVTIAGQPLNKRDGFGVWETNQLSLNANTDSKVLLMEVPMQLQT